MRLLRKQTEDKWVTHPENEAIKARIGPMPLSNVIWKRDVFRDEEGRPVSEIDFGKTGREQFVHCVKELKGMEDADGKPIVKWTRELKEKIYDYSLLPEDIFSWLMEEIGKLNATREETEKNSSSSQSGTRTREPKGSTAKSAEG